MISIIIPVYNASKYIEQCIESILDQTFQDFELIIGDDCSTDNTFQIIEKYKYDERIRILCNKENIGWVKNCNLLISKTRFDYYCIIPSDDYIPKMYIETLFHISSQNKTIQNCFPYIITVGDLNTKIFQNNLDSENIKDRIIDFILYNRVGVSFRGLVKKSENPELLYLVETMRNNMFADTFQILQHAISGKLIGADIPYYKRYHENNIHTKWDPTSDDVMDYYFSIYMMTKKYVTGTHEIIHAIHKRCNIKPLWLDCRLKNTFDVIVLGGGMQGCCCALWLKKRGLNVCIIDRNNELMNGASKNHEGKIHLGFVYSNDKTFGTAYKMLNDALNFSNIMEDLLEKKINWDHIKSKKFLYLIPKTSLISDSELYIFFNKIQDTYETIITKDIQLNYLGKRPKILFTKIEIPNTLDKDLFQSCYDTEEYSINQEILNQEIIETIISKDIPIFNNHNITSVQACPGYYKVNTDKDIFYSDRVMNCLWDNKTFIDNYVLDDKCDNINYRFKCGIISKTIETIQDYRSITFVNGPFGDFVNFADYMYFSWYSYSMKAFICSDKPPENWNINHLISDRQDFLISHSKIFNSIFQKTFDFINPKIIGGIIVAKGTTDIHKIDSQLHERKDPPIHHINNYFSISTGKYTSAPYNTSLLQNYIH